LEGVVFHAAGGATFYIYGAMIQYQPAGRSRSVGSVHGAGGGSGHNMEDEAGGVPCVRHLCGAAHDSSTAERVGMGGEHDTAPSVEGVMERDEAMPLHDAIREHLRTHRGGVEDCLDVDGVEGRESIGAVYDLTLADGEPHVHLTLDMEQEGDDAVAACGVGGGISISPLVGQGLIVPYIGQFGGVDGLLGGAARGLVDREVKGNDAVTTCGIGDGVGVGAFVGQGVFVPHIGQFAGTDNGSGVARSGLSNGEVKRVVNAVAARGIVGGVTVGACGVTSERLPMIGQLVGAQGKLLGRGSDGRLHIERPCDNTVVEGFGGRNSDEVDTSEVIVPSVEKGGVAFADSCGGGYAVAGAAIVGIDIVLPGLQHAAAVAGSEDGSLATVGIVGGGRQVAEGPVTVVPLGLARLVLAVGGVEEVLIAGVRAPSVTIAAIEDVDGLAPFGIVGKDVTEHVSPRTVDPFVGDVLRLLSCGVIDTLGLGQPCPCGALPAVGGREGGAPLLVVAVFIPIEPYPCAVAVVVALLGGALAAGIVVVGDAIDRHPCAVGTPLVAGLEGDKTRSVVGIFGACARGDIHAVVPYIVCLKGLEPVGVGGETLGATGEDPCGIGIDIGGRYGAAIGIAGALGLLAIDPCGSGVHPRILDSAAGDILGAATAMPSVVAPRVGRGEEGVALGIVLVVHTAEVGPCPVAPCEAEGGGGFAGSVVGGSDLVLALPVAIAPCVVGGEGDVTAVVVGSLLFVVAYPCIGGGVIRRVVRLEGLAAGVVVGIEIAVGRPPVGTVATIEDRGKEVARVVIDVGVAIVVGPVVGSGGPEERLCVGVSSGGIVGIDGLGGACPCSVAPCVGGGEQGATCVVVSVLGAGLAYPCAVGEGVGLLGYLIAAVVVPIVSTGGGVAVMVTADNAVEQALRGGHG